MSVTVPHCRALGFRLELSRHDGMMKVLLLFAVAACRYIGVLNYRRQDGKPVAVPRTRVYIL